MTKESLNLVDKKQLLSFKLITMHFVDEQEYLVWHPGVRHIQNQYCCNLQCPEMSHLKSDGKMSTTNLRAKQDSPVSKERQNELNAVKTDLNISHTHLYSYIVWAGYSVFSKANRQSRTLIRLDWKPLPLYCPHI